MNYASECSGAFFIGENMKITELAEEYKQQSEQLKEKAETLRRRANKEEMGGEAWLRTQKKINAYEEMAAECWGIWHKLAHYYDDGEDGHAL